MGQYANIKDAFLHCDVDKLILEYCKIPDGESSKVTIERASAEVHAAMERINQTEPEKTEKQNLLIVCKTYEKNGEDMKTFILENIYMSDMSAPSVYSTDRFPTFESAMEEAHKQFKEEAKTYRKSYGADNITTEECYRDLYIKGPDFTDWWTVVEVPTAEEEDE